MLHAVSISSRGSDEAVLKRARVWRAEKMAAWGVFLQLVEVKREGWWTRFTFKESEMPQYANPDNPNAGELIATKVDPVSGMVVEVAPHTEPSFLPVQDDPDRPSQGKEAPKPVGEQSEADIEAAADADEAQKAVEADLKADHDRGETSGKRSDDPPATKTTTKSAKKAPKPD